MDMAIGILTMATIIHNLTEKNTTIDEGGKMASVGGGGGMKMRWTDGKITV
jgi:hypothetical protein